MIRYSLRCDSAHEFDAWFSAGADFDRQVESGFLTCPVCGSHAITKRLMTPSVAVPKPAEPGRRLVMDPAQKEAIDKIKEVAAAVRANAEDVGEQFPEEARKIHYGEADQRGIVGQASPQEAKALIDEGIHIAPLPVFPDDVN